MNQNRDVVLVTGSSGLIGTALVEFLGTRFNVIGLDRPGLPHPPPAVYCVEVDITSDESVQKGLADIRSRFGERIASVVHLAAYYDFSGEPSPLYEQVTVRGTERLVHALAAFRVEQFIFSSTMLVHKPCEPGQRIAEDWPIEPKWDYPKSKVDTEQLLLRHYGNIPIVVLRIAGVYNDECHSIPLAHQIERIHQRRLTSHVYPGDISRGQAFVHLDDLLDAIEKAIDRRRGLLAFLPVLIGEPETLSYDTLQREFAQLIHGEGWETRQIPKALAKAGAWVQDALPGEEPFIKPWMIDLADDHYALDIACARNMLGWEPDHRLLGTLPKMVDALKRDPVGWYHANHLEVPSWVEEEAAVKK